MYPYVKIELTGYPYYYCYYYYYYYYHNGSNNGYYNIGYRITLCPYLVGGLNPSEKY